MENKNKRRKLIPLCTLSMVFALLLFSPLYPVVSVDAAFSSIAITNVNPTEFSPGDTSKVVLTVKNNGGRDASDIRLSFQGTENISPVGPKVVNINTLNSWCSKEVEITMQVKEKALNGVYPIPVSCLWTEYHLGYPVVNEKNVHRANGDFEELIRTEHEKVMDYLKQLDEAIVGEKDLEHLSEKVEHAITDLRRVESAADDLPKE